MQRKAALLLSLSAVACGPYAAMVTPDVNTPVTVGPVTRIGGHRAGGEKTLATVRGESADFVAASRNENDLGNGTVAVTQETTAMSMGPGLVSSIINDKTANNTDRDTRIDEVGVGAYAFISFGSVIAERWVRVNGRVVEVDHAR